MVKVTFLLIFLPEQLCRTVICSLPGSKSRAAIMLLKNSLVPGNSSLHFTPTITRAPGAFFVIQDGVDLRSISSSFFL
jgi:hypothetical protein